ncbi:MAG: class I lanthipeptide [Hyalangium sp.]|uniref:class I lanthipeptide n=1 Tax=Hyalangium sp. TaxID=2028555 RepID=UPI00389B20FD
MKKLQLKKETLKVLADEKLDQVRGGAVVSPVPVPACCGYSRTAIDSCNASASCPPVAAQ